MKSAATWIDESRKCPGQVDEPRVSLTAGEIEAIQLDARADAYAALQALADAYRMNTTATLKKLKTLQRVDTVYDQVWRQALEVLFGP